MQHLRPQTWLTFVILSLAFIGCSGPETVHEYKVENLEIVLAGPLFEGPNAGQFELTLDIPGALGDAYAPGMKVADARLQRAEVAAGDSLGFAQVRSFVLSFASDNEAVAMEEAAFVNPLPEGLERVALNVAPEAELGPHAAEEKLYVVLDVDLSEDFWDGDRLFLLNFELSLTLQSKR